MKTLLRKIRQLLRNRRFRQIWYRGVSTFAAIIVFVTTYALILPAITLERVAACGLEEHQHDPSCFTEVLICNEPESDGHRHTDDCYTVTRVLECEIEEHQHGGDCYDENGELICSLPEHTHGDDCYKETKKLICGEKESEGHYHDSSCYEKVLTCGREVHVHSAACYKDDAAATAATESAAVAATGSAAAVTENASAALTESASVMMTESTAVASTEIVDAAASTGAPALEIDESTEEAYGSSNSSSTDENEAAADNSMDFDTDDTANDASTAATTNVLSGELADMDEENLSDGYVPALDAVDIETLLDKHTGFYYFDASAAASSEDGESDVEIPASSAEITDWKKYESDDKLEQDDLLRLYLSYTIPAGTLNSTNQVARYHLPSNIRLTDEQILAINETVNGVTNGYVDMSTLEIADPDKYELYRGAEAVEGTRRPDQDINDYLYDLVKDGEDGQEYISAIVKAENVFDDEGIYGEKGIYLGQDLIFIFTPYTISKNQNEYDKNGKPVKAGEKITGWFACDFNMSQVEWEESGVTSGDGENGGKVEKTAEVVLANENKEIGTKENVKRLTLIDNSTEDKNQNADDAAESETMPAVSFDDSVRVRGAELESDSAFLDPMTGRTTIKVHVEADKDTFPEGTSMILSAVDDLNTVAETVQSAVESSEQTTDTVRTRGFHAVDISFRDAEGNEIEPLKPIRVSISSDQIKKAVEDESTTPVVVHVEGTQAASTVDTERIEEAESRGGYDSQNDTLTFEAGSFSVYAVVYTVDFHWEVNGKTYEYSLAGGDSISIRKLVEMLHVVNNDAQDGDDSDEETSEFINDIADIRFSNESLVKVVQITEEITSGALKQKYELECEYSSELTSAQQEAMDSKVFYAPDWALISLKAFDTEENLTVNMKDGEVFTIRVTDAQIKRTVIDAKGDSWEIIVSYGEDAQIPDEAELIVREILPEDDEYADLYEEASRKASDNAEKQGIEVPVVTGARLFDIEIHGDDGKIEPKSPVHVVIKMAGEEADLLSVVHFAENGAEVMELHDILAKGKPAYDVEESDSEGNAEEIKENLTKEVSFEAESFSVYTIVDVSSANLTTDGPYILVSGIQGDPGADVGYQENWGTDFFTKVVNGMAMTDETREHGLSSIGVHVWTEGTQGFVGGEATQWTFEQGTNGNYYFKDSSGQYLMRSSYTTQNYINQTITHYDGMSLTGDRNAATQFTVTPTGDGDGSVYLTFTYQGQTWYLHNNQYGGSNEWTSRNYMVKQNPTNDEKGSSAFKFKLCKQSDAYDSFAATKVASAQVTTDGNYVIYHKFEDSTGNEELYALASDGSFVRVYDGGDRIYWRETDKNIYWNYQSGDGHHLISIDPSTNAPVYLNPIASGEGQTISTEDHYLTLNGKDNGEYGTTIERWDQVSYDYAGLHVVKDGNTVQLMPGTRNDGTSDEFLFALATSMPKENEAEPVDTVDSDGLGIKITMFDYGNANTEYSAGTKLEEMTAIAGSDAYTPHEAHALVKPYLVSGLPANNSGDAMTGLFDTGGAITGKIEGVNHLFLQSYYDENGTFRYRSEDNYAYIPLDGSNKNFTVYSQIATPYTTDRQVGHAYYYHGHFMPFNDIDMENHLSRLLDQYGTQELPLEDGRTYEDVYGITGTPRPWYQVP